MSSFFIKNLISAGSNPQAQQDQQADLERLIELCNSYGLNEEQTKQLISQFRKGSYQSGANSLNQSMMSDQNDISMMSQNCDQGQIQYNYQQQPIQSMKNIRNDKQSHQFYHEPEYQHQNQSTNRYNGYGNQVYDKNEESYNQMTFNDQNSSLMMNSYNFNQVQRHMAGQNSKGNILKQQLPQQLQQQKPKQEMLEPKPSKDSQPEQKSFTRKNTSKDNLGTSQNIPSQNAQGNNVGSRVSENSKNSRSSISTKVFSQNNEKLLTNQSLNQQKTSQMSSKSSFNSIQQHSIEQESDYGLNPEYIKALIRNFENLENQNEGLKQENENLRKKGQKLIEYHETIKKQNETLKRNFQAVKNSEKMANSQISKLDSLLENERQKSQMLLTMKENDAEVIKGLKDSLVQLTQLIKQKDSQNNQLQQRLFSLYEKIQTKPNYAGTQDLNNVGESLANCFGKSFSKKSLASEYGQKDINSQQKAKQRERTPNYGRRELGEMMISNINLPSNNQLNSQQSKHLARNLSASGLNSSSNQQANPKKGSSICQQMPQVPKESKQNVFTPLQVNPAARRSAQTNKQAQDEMRKRQSSRVDIKKYKGMIEELRNSYSNVGGSNNMMR